MQAGVSCMPCLDAICPQCPPNARECLLSHPILQQWPQYCQLTEILLQWHSFRVPLLLKALYPQMPFSSTPCTHLVWVRKCTDFWTHTGLFLCLKRVSTFSPHCSATMGTMMSWPKCVCKLGYTVLMSGGKDWWQSEHLPNSATNSGRFYICFGDWL